ncbi:hypothetical protein AAP_05862 [Ascosphaera apis ARSEF 7405]|uniref:Uncharacterized protein n=1 Tax=Ascosphaera apis ARSEF 7405 TaxID=392613 RepID=A0A162I0W4_9EURO|nr:hypothetical protein AAP_05862 [Ascosphaera apis ARSEF 7405]
MPNVLLPATAAAYAPRAPPQIILHDPVDRWLTDTLKRAVHVKRPLNKTLQHTKFLRDLLGGPKAIWTLCSLALPRQEAGEACDMGGRSDDNGGRKNAEIDGEENVTSPLSPLSRADGKDGSAGDDVIKYQMLHMNAYVVHIDTVSSRQEIAFKLTQDTIDSLVEYYKQFGHLAFEEFLSEQMDGEEERENQNKRQKKQQQQHDCLPRVPTCEEDFVQDVNRFVFRTDIHAIEGIAEEGDGELLEGRAEKAMKAVKALFSREEVPMPIAAPAMPMSMSMSVASQQQQQFQPNFLLADPNDFGLSNDINYAMYGANDNFWDMAPMSSMATTETATTAVVEPTFASVVENSFSFYPSSPPDSYTAHSPFSSPPMSFRGATASTAVPDFALTSSHEFPSPSPPPSRRHPQPLMAPLAGVAGGCYPNYAQGQNQMAALFEEQASPISLSASAAATGPWYFGCGDLSMSEQMQGPGQEQLDMARFSVGSADTYQEGWQFI